MVKLSRVVMCLLVAAAAGSANAVPITETVTQTTHFSLHNDSNHDQVFSPHTGTHLSERNTETTTLHLDKFDSSLGELTDVSIAFASEFTHKSYGFAYDSTATRTQAGIHCFWSYCWHTYVHENDSWIKGEAAAKLTVSLADPSNNTPVSLTDTNSIDCLAQSHQKGSVSCKDKEVDGHNDFNGAFDLGSLSLTDFIGSDAIKLTLNNHASLNAMCDNGDGQHHGFDYCYTSNQVYWHGKVTTVYTYTTPAMAVPEPGSLALLAAGLAGLYRVRRLTSVGG